MSRKALLLLFLLALSVRAAFWLGVSTPEQHLMPDSKGYIHLAERFTEGVLQPGSAPRQLVGLSMHRTPGYPLFLRLSGGNPVDIRLAMAVQMAVGALAAVLTALLAARLLTPAAGLWAGLLLAMDPASVLYANLALSECLMTVLMLAGLLFALPAVRKASPAWSALSGLLLALSALVRPITLYLPLALAPWVLFWRERPRRGRARRLLAAALMAGGFAALCGGWMWRNHELSGKAFFTAMEWANLNYRAAWAIADQDGIPLESAFKRIDAMDLEHEDGRNIPHLFNNITSHESVRLMLSHPKGLAISSLRGLFYLLAGPGRGALWQLTGVQSHALRMAMAAVAAAMLLAIYLLGLYGIRGLWREGRRRELGILLTLLGYFVLLSTAPEAYSRFRAPAMPFLCILAGYGASRLPLPTFLGRTTRSRPPRQEPGHER